MKLAFALVAALGAFAAPAARSAIVSIDQSNIVDVAGSAIPIAGGGFGSARTGQLFTPTFSSINAVDFALVDLGGTGLGGDVSIIISQGVLGTNLAQSQNLVLADGFGTLGSGPVAAADVAHFEFLTPVALTPGVQYFLHFFNHGGDPFGFRGIDADTYAGGSAVVEFDARPGADAWFVVGLTGDVPHEVPEPSSLVLVLGAGLAALAMHGRRRRSRKLQAIRSRP